MNTLGQVAYKAFQKSISSTEPIEPFDQLPPWIQEAWEESAKTAVLEKAIIELNSGKPLTHP